MSRFRVVIPACQRNEKDNEQTFKERFFLNYKEVSYKEINRSVYGSRYIKMVRLEDEGG